MPARAPDPVPDPDLAAERDHLVASRAALSRMRDRAAALDSSAAGDAVSQQFLESALLTRMKALADDPTVPLFFGRLDYDEEHEDAHGERFYIGRRHVSDEVGDPLVIDWRARISLAFYRASQAEPMGVRLRRRFGFSQGSMTAYEDEALLSGVVEDHSVILEAEIERPRVGPMRDIVATIQPEQDVIVRSDLTESVCVQGAPGTGKTAVGLHRAAFLLYAHRDQLTRQGVLVVGPNASFLRYIGDVLPALGEIEAQQTTIEGLVAKTLTRLHPKYAVRGVDPAAVAVLKGDARLATVVHRALWSQVRPPTEGLLVPRGARRWRVAPYEVDEVLAELRSRGVRYGAARAMLAQQLAHRILVKMENSGDSPDDRVQDAVARSREMRKYVDATWPAVDPARLVLRLLGDADTLATAADGLLTAEEQALLLWSRPARTPTSAPWSLADAVLIDEAADLVERTPSLGHVVADEAQDLSPMMLRAVGRRCSTGSATVLGDLAQATTPWATRSWREALGHLGKPEAHVEQLTRGFRVPGEVIEYAARLLPVIAPGLEPPTSVRRTRGELVVERDRPGRLVELVAATAERVGSVGLIAPDVLVPEVVRALTDAGIRHAVLGEETVAEDFEVRLDVVPASLAKGLEFDHVVLLEPAGIVAGEADRVTGLRRLYVCLTRAVTSLAIVHSDPLPEELGAPLASRWPPGRPEALRTRLETAYGDPGRGYHDLLHLTEVLQHVEELLDPDDPAREAVLLGAWFHDAVYDGRADDEERSARLAETSLDDAGADADLVAEVGRLVRLTAAHRPADDDHAGQVLCDADLAILAAGPDRYASYVAGVRVDHSHVGDEDFAAGRAAVLRDLLAKPSLFHTEAGRERWEEQSRENLEREISTLEGG